MARLMSRDEELQRVSRALRTLSGSNRALLRANDRQELLQAICRVVVEEAGYCAAAVVRAEQDERHSVTPLAHVGDDDVFGGLQTMTWDERTRSATSIALRTREPCLVNDVQNSPLIAPAWREFHGRHGFGSVYALPLMLGQQLFGALTILAPEPDAFDEFERQPLLEAAADLAFGLQTLAARERHAAAEEAVRRLMLYEPISGLPNRAHLRQLLAQAIIAARAARQPLVLMRLAIERFQEMDQLLGGAVAERLVSQVGQRLRSTLDPEIVVAHTSEAEFAVVVPCAGAEKGRQIARQLMEVAAEPHEVDALRLETRLVAGIAVFPGHGTDADVLNRRAGQALFHSRRRSKPVSVFTSDLDSSCDRNVSLMAELRKGIPGGELRLYCQPKLEMGRRRTCGLEALVRWQHPSRGLLNPGEFIQLAESTGLITSLTYWVLEDALRQLYAWREMGIDHPVSVNMSAHDLRDAHFLERVSDKLATWGARAGSVEFELTESALMEDPIKALEVLHGLKQLDVMLSIDDFGTGYSSLSYLRELPVDAIKIDQSFVRGLVSDAGCAAIVRSTIDLAHNLHLNVIAEGVEDEPTFDALTQLGCDAAQGFCIGRPMPAAEFQGWLGAQPLH
ncbi:MAG: putative bifunctional diguanylate cyclase/phosphodiesterase [Vitreoscilla sp.]